MSDDRSTKARIRDAGIACFAEYGTAGTTARRVAKAADVSAGLVMHYYGSMEGLRAACDEHVAAVIRQVKHDAVSAGPQLDVFATLRGSSIGPLLGYLARVLSEDSPAVAGLVDDLVADAESYMQEGIDAGMVKPTNDLRGWATILMMWSLGALVLHRHMHRILGIDLADPNLGENPALAAYAVPAYEILSAGIFTEEFGNHVLAAFAETTAPGIQAPSTPAASGAASTTTNKGPR